MTEQNVLSWLRTEALRLFSRMTGPVDADDLEDFGKHVLKEVARLVLQQAACLREQANATNGATAHLYHKADALQDFAVSLQRVCPVCGEVDDADGKHNSGCPDCRARHLGPGREALGQGEGETP